MASNEPLHFIWFVPTVTADVPMPILRKLPSDLGSCAISRHLELNPSTRGMLWIVGVDTRPTIAPPLTMMHPMLEVRATTRHEVLNGSLLARWAVRATEGGRSEACGGAHRQLEPQSGTGSYGDLLRLALLYTHGGTYLDLDELPIAPLPAAAALGHDHGSDAGRGWVSEQIGNRITPPFNNAAFAFPKRHACLRALLEAADATLRTCHFKTKWGMFGPTLFTKLFDPGWAAASGARPPVPECKGVARLRPSVFSPISWQRARSFYRFSPRFNHSWLAQQAVNGTRALHLFTSNLGITRSRPKAAEFLQRLRRLGLCHRDTSEGTLN